MKLSYRGARLRPARKPLRSLIVRTPCDRPHSKNARAALYRARGGTHLVAACLLQGSRGVGLTPRRELLDPAASLQRRVEVPHVRLLLCAAAGAVFHRRRGVWHHVLCRCRQGCAGMLLWLRWLSGRLCGGCACARACAARGGWPADSLHAEVARAARFDACTHSGCQVRRV